MLKNLKLMTSEKLILRLATSYMLVSLVVLVLVRSLNINMILTSVNPFISAGCIAGLFLLLCTAFLKNDDLFTEKKLMFYSMIMFFAVTLAVSEKGNGYDFGSTALFTVEAIVTALTSRYVFGAEISGFGISKKKNKVIITVIAVTMGLYIFITGALKYLAFECETWDFGIFTQMFANMRSTLIPYVTCERNKLMSHFGIHFSPVYYLMLPFYAVVPSALTLLLVQAAGVVSGVIPVYLLCKKFRQGEMITLALCLAYLINPFLACGVSYDMHENFFLAPFLLWLFCFIEKDKPLLTFVFAVLILCIKKDATLYVLSAALYIFFEKKKRKQGVLLFSVAIVWFLAVVLWLSQFGDGTLTMEHYLNFGPSFFKGFLTTVIAYPSYVLSQLIDDRYKIEFALQILIPFAFLPVMSKKIPSYLLLIPLVIMNLIPSYRYQHSIFFHYNLGSFACLMYLYVKSVSELKKETKRFVCAFSVAVCIILSVSTTTRMSTDIPSYISDYEKTKVMWETAKSIPEDASVTASPMFVTYLSNNFELYSINQNVKIDVNDYDSEYIVLDLREYIAKGYNCDINEFNHYLKDKRYKLITYNEGLSAVFRRVSDTK